jgi:CubicO group peptidase (beta-lactamase class C family)
MKIIKLLLLLFLVFLVLAASWYYRPWSPYSPASMSSLSKPERMAENFRNMGDLMPADIVKTGFEIREFSGRSEPLELSFVYEGNNKSLEAFLTDSTTMGLMVLKNGVIRHEQYRLDADAESLFTSWSVAKSFVATVIAMAHKEGLIESLSDPAEKYAPQYKGSDFGKTSINALLSMSSGIKFDENYDSNSSDIRPFFFNTFIRGKNPDSLLLTFEQSRPEFSDFQYISSNSHVLSAVVRGVYKKPLAQIMSEKIWQPLGMEANATWLKHRDDAKGQALGYCCLNARLRDYARFGQFYLEAVNGVGIGADSLSQEWLLGLPIPDSDAHKPGGENYLGRGYSQHFWLPKKAGVFFASGIYGQSIWVDPARNLVIVKTSADQQYSTRFNENAAAFEAISAHFD